MRQQLSWQLATRHEHRQLNVDGGRIFGEVFPQQEHPASIGYAILKVRNTDFSVVAHRHIFLRPVVNRIGRDHVVTEGQ